MKRKLLKLSSILSGFVFSFVVKARCFAADMDIQDMLSGEGAAGSGGALEGFNNMIDYYGKGTTFSIKKLAFYIAFGVGLFISIKFMAGSGNANSTAENKKAVGPFLVGVLGISCMVGLIVLISGIGDNLFNF